MSKILDFFLKSRFSDEYVGVSVIISVYNSEDYLSECLDSVITQSLDNIEILCIDDGSSDSSLDILKEYAEKDNRIRILSTNHEGEGPSKNLGINEAKGEYVCFVNAEDCIKEDMLEKLYLKSLEYDLEVNISKATYMDDKFIEDEISSYYGLKYFKEFDIGVFKFNKYFRYIFNIAVTPFVMFYKRSFLLNNGISFSKELLFNDELFFFNVYSNAKKVSFIDEVLYFYRFNNFSSLSISNNDVNRGNICSFFDFVDGFLKERSVLIYSVIDFYNNFISLLLIRFSECGLDLQEEFFNIIKDKFSDFPDDLLNSLDLSIKDRFCKILSSDTFDEFKVVDSEKMFSVVMAIYNTEDYLEEAIDSVINQDVGFLNNIELVLVNDGSEDSSGDICLRYCDMYPYNVKYIYQENQGQSVARNNGLKLANGRYLNFLDSDDKFSSVSFKFVYQFLEENYDETDVACVPIKLFGAKTGDHPLNYKFNKTRVVDLLDEPNNIQLSASSSFIKRISFKNMGFNQDLIASEDSLLISKLLLNNPKLGIIKEATYFYRKRESGGSTIDGVSSKVEYYLPRLEGYFKEVISISLELFDSVPGFIQYNLMYGLHWMFRIQEFPKDISEDEIKKIFEDYKYILSYIDDKVIKNHIPRNIHLNNIAFMLKYSEKRFEIRKGKVYCFAGNNILSTLNSHIIYLDSVEVNNHMLNISGYLNSLFSSEISIEAFKYENIDLEQFSSELKDSVNPKVFKSKEIFYPLRDKLNMGRRFQKKYNFDLTVSLNEFENSIIKFKVNFRDEIKINLLSKMVYHAQLSDKSNYFKTEDYIIKFINNSLIISNASNKLLDNYENENVKNLLRLYEKKNMEIENTKKLIDKFYKKLDKLFKESDDLYSAISLRNKSFLVDDLDIWLFMDRPDKADDNGEALFRFAVAQNDGIDKYFVIEEDSPDFCRLKEEFGDKIIIYASEDHKLLYLLAKKIVSSHPDNSTLNPLWQNEHEYLTGCINCKYYFLQHGIILHNISDWLHRFDKHLSLVLTSNRDEYESFFKHPYNYSRDVVQLLGLPRHDNLKSVSGVKSIVLMPTWRKPLKNYSMEEFESSDYCEVFSSLLSNKYLISYLKREGYELVFKPHPNVIDFIDCFDIDDYVKIDTNSRYVDIFNRSSLLVTDYSSVVFDFAYLKKPVCYYQFDNDSFHYDLEDNYFDYETMGFGKIITEENDLVDTIINYVEKDCKMEDKYIQRVDDFFEFTDGKNCKRTYDWILNH